MGEAEGGDSCLPQTVQRHTHAHAQRTQELFTGPVEPGEMC